MTSSFERNDMLLKQDEFKMQDSPKAGFWDYFQNFKQAYESCRLGVLGMCDYKYAGGYLNSQFESCDPISNTLNAIEMISGRESISPYSAVVNNFRKLQSEMTSGELPLLTSTISKGLSVAGKTAKSAVTKVTLGEMPCLDKLSKAGQAMDRGGLTKAGRALDKHGGRSNSAFPKATGNLANKNMQGDILTHPESKTFKDVSNGYEIYAPDGRGAYFRNDGLFRGWNDKFRIRLCSDLDYEEMVADIVYEDSTVATISQEKGINKMEIKYFLY